MPRTVQDEGQLFPVRPDVTAKAHLSEVHCRDMTDRAARDPHWFLVEQARRTAWTRAPTKLKNTSFAGHVSIKWFKSATLADPAVVTELLENRIR